MWLDQLLIELNRCGTKGQSAVRFLNENGIHVILHDQPTAARWTLNGQIQLHPRYALGLPSEPYPLSLVVHEVKHLQQGLFTALSVYGEVEAWQLQFSFIKTLTGRYHSNSHSDAILIELMSLEWGMDRSVLHRASILMKAYAGKNYLINLLPLYLCRKKFNSISSENRVDIF